MTTTIGSTPGEQETANLKRSRYQGIEAEGREAYERGAGRRLPADFVYRHGADPLHVTQEEEVRAAFYSARRMVRPVILYGLATLGVVVTFLVIWGSTIPG